MFTSNENKFFSYIYDKFGNLFLLSYKIGKLYKKSMSTSNKGDEKTIYFNGNYFSYEWEEGSQEMQPTLEMIKRMVKKQFILKIESIGYQIIKKKYIIFSEQDIINLPHNDIFSIFDGFEFRFVIINNALLLCVNPHLVIKTNCSIKYLIEQNINPDKLKDFSIRYKGGNEEQIDGYLIETITDEESLCRVRDYREFKIETLPADVVFPEPRAELIQHLLNLLGRDFDLIAKQRELSFLDSKTASKDRFRKTLEIVNALKKNVFPLSFGDWEINLETTPIVIKL